MKQFLLLLFLVCTISFGQKLTTSEELEADHFIGFDAYQNLFYTKGMVVFKKGPSGVFEFTDFQLGPISSVDIVNPLKIVVYYQQTNTAVLLDNTLTQIERFNFNTLPPYINTSAATNAGGNKLWIFNQDSQQLELFNYRTSQKTELSQPIAETLKRQMSTFNYCYLLTEKQVTGYNPFGGVLATILFENAENIVQHNETVLLLRDNELYKILKDSEKTTNYLSPEINIQDLQLTQDFLYIYDGKRVHTFVINQTNK